MSRWAQAHPELCEQGYDMRDYLTGDVEPDEECGCDGDCACEEDE